MTTSNHALLDTNILVYAANEDAPFHGPAQTLRDRGLRGELQLCVASQVLFEFFAVITDSRRIDAPLSCRDAAGEIEMYYHAPQITKIYPGADTIPLATDLMRRNEVTRQDIFDLYLVATMLSNNITRLYTYNRADFSRFQEIEVLTP